MNACNGRQRQPSRSSGVGHGPTVTGATLVVSEGRLVPELRSILFDYIETFYNRAHHQARFDDHTRRDLHCKTCNDRVSGSHTSSSRTNLPVSPARIVGVGRRITIRGTGIEEQCPATREIGSSTTATPRLANRGRSVPGVGQLDRNADDLIFLTADELLFAATQEDVRARHLVALGGAVGVAEET